MLCVGLLYTVNATGMNGIETLTAARAEGASQMNVIHTSGFSSHSSNAVQG